MFGRGEDGLIPRGRCPAHRLFTAVNSQCREGVRKMSESPKLTEEFLNDVVSAWEELAPSAQFAGLSLAQFKAKVQPSFDTRTELETLETQIKATRQSRRNADAVSNEDALNVVNGVRSTPGYGENSALYKAMDTSRRMIGRAAWSARPRTRWSRSRRRSPKGNYSRLNRFTSVQLFCFCGLPV